MLQNFSAFCPGCGPLQQAYGLSGDTSGLDTSLPDLVASAQFFVLTAHSLQQKANFSVSRELLRLPPNLSPQLYRGFGSVSLLSELCRSAVTFLSANDNLSIMLLFSPP